MTKEEAYKTLKENLCAMCAYGSQNMESCNIRSCDNRDAIETLEQEKPETVSEFADRCRECGAKYGKLLKQDQKTGHWINNQNGTYTCDKCGGKHSRSNYCPNCSAKMVEIESEKTCQK